MASHSRVAHVRQSARGNWLVFPVAKEVCFVVVRSAK